MTTAPAPIPDSPPPWTLPDPIPTRWHAPGLILRTFDTADALALRLAIDESRESLWPWLPWARDQHLTLAGTLFTIQKFESELTPVTHAAGKLNLVVGIFDVTTGRLLGGTGAHTFRPSAHQAEIGYWVRTSERGRGICTRAAAAMIDWLFAPQSAGGFKLRRAEIICAGGNSASAAVARKLGARDEGRLAGDRWIAGRGWDDTLRFAVSRET